MTEIQPEIGLKSHLKLISEVSDKSEKPKIQSEKPETQSERTEISSRNTHTTYTICAEQIPINCTLRNNHAKQTPRAPNKCLCKTALISCPNPRDCIFCSPINPLYQFKITKQLTCRQLQQHRQ